MTKKKHPISEALDFIVELLQRYDEGTVGDKTRNALDSWNPDTQSTDSYPMDEDKAANARAKAHQNVLAHVHTEQRSRIIQSMWRNTRQYAAAAVLIFLIAGGIWIVSRKSESYKSLSAEVHQSWVTDQSQRLSIKLPDGTMVKVNAGSRLEISKASFGQRKREVWLTGEAFFDVVKNPEKPFIIHTGSMQTTVRGTSFNIKAYPQLSENVVSVRSGKVEVSDATQNFGILTHNKQLTYSTANRKGIISESNWEDAAGWIEGRLVLNGGVEELRLRLRQQFGVEVSFEKNALANERLTGTFNPNSKLTDVLTTIGAIYNIRYTIKSNHVTITKAK